MADKKNDPMAEAQRLSEEFRLKAHLASMEAKTRWDEELKPRLRKLEERFDKAVDESNLNEEVSKLEKQLRKLVDGLTD